MTSTHVWYLNESLLSTWLLFVQSAHVRCVLCYDCFECCVSVEHHTCVDGKCVWWCWNDRLSRTCKLTQSDGDWYRLRYIRVMCMCMRECVTEMWIWIYVVCEGGFRVYKWCVVAATSCEGLLLMDSGWNYVHLFRGKVWIFIYQNNQFYNTKIISKHWKMKFIMFFMNDFNDRLWFRLNFIKIDLSKLSKMMKFL